VYWSRASVAEEPGLSRLSQILNTLESYYGPQTPQWPTDAYQFLLWWHCGYPQSEERCTRGWESLNERIGISPKRLLETPSSTLAGALKAGGMIPELRAGRLKQIAEQVAEQFDGDLNSALSGLPVMQVRALLKQFPGIGDPGADRIMLFGGIATVAAVPSSCPQVLMRIETGTPHKTYNANYRDSQQIIQSQLAETFAARTRAYLLVLRHGHQVCKRSSPKCGMCAIARSCAFFASTSRARPERAARR
jgi:endonuclease III